MSKMKDKHSQIIWKVITALMAVNQQRNEMPHDECNAVGNQIAVDFMKTFPHRLINRPEIAALSIMGYHLREQMKISLDRRTGFFLVASMYLVNEVEKLENLTDAEAEEYSMNAGLVNDVEASMFKAQSKEPPPPPRSKHIIEPYQQGTAYKLEQPSKGPRISYVSIFIGSVVVFLVLVMINS
jgi:hypothetical protein